MQSNEKAQQSMDVLTRRKSIVPEESPIPLGRLPVEDGKNSAPEIASFNTTEENKVQPVTISEPVNTSYKKARLIAVLLTLLFLIIGSIAFIMHWFAALVYVLIVAITLALLKRNRPEMFAKLKRPKQPQKAELAKQDFVEVIDSVFKVDTMLASQNLSSVIQILINKASFVIGSQASTCDYVLNMDNSISRKHFRIIFAKIGGRTAYYIEDLNSRNGTAINGQRLIPGEPHVLQYGDQITISGKFNFIVRSTSY